MKKIIAVFTITLATLTTAAFATQRPVESLNDLPQRWEGVAGNFTTKVPATFVITKIRSVQREDRADGLLSAAYEIDGTMTMGERQVSVKKLSLTRYSRDANHLEMGIVMDDELALAAIAVVHYDEASNTYTLRDIPNQGERRFSFSAPAPRR